MRQQLRRYWEGLGRLLERAASDWTVSRPQIWILFAIPFVLPLITILAALFHRPTFDVLTGEDQLGEWLQVAAWVGALLLAIAVLTHLIRSGSRLLAFLYGALVLAMIFIVGEEISWGQRIIGFGTPESLAEANRQGEVNFHNLTGVQTAFSWAMFVVGAYGTLAPVWAIRRWGEYGAWPRITRALVPHWVLIPYFLLMFVWRFYRNLFEPIESLYVGISEFGETTELVLALAFLAFVWHQRRELRQPPPLAE